MRALILATVITVIANVSGAYTEQEMNVLMNDCRTSLAIHRQANRNKVIAYWDIHLKTGDNCYDLLRSWLVNTESPSYMKEWDKRMSCVRIAQEMTNANGGIQALPFPDKLKLEYENTVVDGETCKAINARNKRR